MSTGTINTVDLFAEVVKVGLEEAHPECSVVVHKVTKNNNLVLTGISIRSREVNLAPTIYMDGYYNDYKNGRPMMEIIAEVVEDYNVGFFSYECKVFLIDYNGVVKGEGVGITNTREGKYAKSNGYSVQNVVLKMAKKRALVDGVLNVGNLSARFTQDVEDMNLEPEQSVGKNPEGLDVTDKVKSSSKPATKKQIQYLQQLMQQHGNSEESMNRYVKQAYGIDDYTKVSGVQASELVEKYKSLEQ